MLSEQLNITRMELNDNPKVPYERKLEEIREKYLVLLGKLTKKYGEYEKIYFALKDKRPTIEWLSKLEVTCEKIQKKLTQHFFEKHNDEQKKDGDSNTLTSEEIDNDLSDRKETTSEKKILKRSRWDVWLKENNLNEEEVMKRKETLDDNSRVLNDKKIVNHISSEKRTTVKNLTIVNVSEEKGDGFTLSKNKTKVKAFHGTVLESFKTCGKKVTGRQKTPVIQSVEVSSPDTEVEIIASISGRTPPRRSKSQTRFATLEEVNKSPFYKKFTTDNMTLDSRAANLKVGTVFDLVKSKEAEANRKQPRKHLSMKDECLPKKPAERKGRWHDKGNFENKKYLTNSSCRDIVPTKEKFHAATLNINDKTYKNLQSAVKFLEINKETNNHSYSSRKNVNSFRKKYENPGNKCSSNKSLYKENLAHNSTCSPYSVDKSSPVRADRHPQFPPPKDHYLPNQCFTNTQYSSSVSFPQQAPSFYCNCYQNHAPYCSSVGTTYQTSPCAIANNYGYYSTQYFPVQTAISPPNTNLPTPFPTFAVPPPSTTDLSVSVPSYSVSNTNIYSVPVFCDGGTASSSRAALSTQSWLSGSNIRQQPASRNFIENLNKQKDPRVESGRLTSALSTSNISQKLSVIDTALENSFKYQSRISSIPEERFSKSCTFLRPDNLYNDFKCRLGDENNKSSDTLRTLEPSNNVTNENPSCENSFERNSHQNPNYNNLYNDDKNHSKEVSIINRPENIKDKSKDKRDETPKLNDKSLQHSPGGYISPLTNLYTGSLSPNSKTNKSDDCALNKQKENISKKRKIREVVDSKIEHHDCKKKFLDKDKTTVKLDDEKSEFFSTKRKYCTSESSKSKNCKANEIKVSEMENSPTSEDTDISTELWRDIESPTEQLLQMAAHYETSSEEQEVEQTKYTSATQQLAYDNSQIHNKQKSVGSKKSTEKNSPYKKSSSDKSRSTDHKKIPREKIVAKQKCIEKNSLLNKGPGKKDKKNNVKAIPEKEAMREISVNKEKHLPKTNSKKSTKTDKDDTIRDLLMKMKSLPQSEALKVISEFACTLNNDTPQQANGGLTPKIAEKRDKKCTQGEVKIKDEFRTEFPSSLKIENNITNMIIDNSVKLNGPPSKINICNSNNTNTTPAYSGKGKLSNKCDVTLSKHNKTITFSKEKVKNVKTSKSTSKISNEMSVLEVNNSKRNKDKCTKKSNCKIQSNNKNEENCEKLKCNKKKKLSELEKIHADLDSCSDFDDIMKCSGIRTCRIRNEFGGILRENSTDDKPNKKEKVTQESPFIEDEITIKMEPIPEPDFGLYEGGDYSYALQFPYPEDVKPPIQIFQ